MATRLQTVTQAEEKITQAVRKADAVAAQVQEAVGQAFDARNTLLHATDSYAAAQKDFLDLQLGEDEATHAISMLQATKHAEQMLKPFEHVRGIDHAMASVEGFGLEAYLPEVPLEPGGEMLLQPACADLRPVLVLRSDQVHSVLPSVLEC